MTAPPHPTVQRMVFGVGVDSVEAELPLWLELLRFRIVERTREWVILARDSEVLQVMLYEHGTFDANVPSAGAPIFIEVAKPAAFAQALRSVPYAATPHRRQTIAPVYDIDRPGGPELVALPGVHAALEPSAEVAAPESEIPPSSVEPDSAPPSDPLPSDYSDSDPPESDYSDSDPPESDYSDSDPPASDYSDSDPPESDYSDSDPPAYESPDSGPEASESSEDSTSAIHIHEISPQRGPQQGDDSITITITGTGFTDECVVRFGDEVVTPSTIAEGVIRMLAPSCTRSGHIDVRVEDPDGNGETRVNGYFYESPPVIERVSPSITSTEGGEISIFGRHLDDVRNVIIGDIRCTIKVIEKDRIAIDAPPHPPGEVGLTVVGGDGQSTTVSSALEYRNRPTITSITPARGLLEGGTEVTITGEHFAEGCTIAFFDTSPDCVYVSPTVIRFATPPRQVEGPGVIRVHNPDGLFSTREDGFTYHDIEPPNITAVEPNTVWSAGGAHLTIVGTGFHAACAVTIGGAPAEVVARKTDRVIAKVPPIATLGPASVTILNPRDLMSNDDIKVTVVPPPNPPKLIEVRPSKAFGSPGQQIELIGQNFDSSTIVRIGDVRAVVRTVTTNQITVELPPSTDVGPVAIELGDASGVAIRTEEAFCYEKRPAPQPGEITPNRAFAGARVTIEGQHLYPGTTVRFDRVAATVVSHPNSHSMVLTVPASRHRGVVDVQLFGPEGGETTMEKAFEYRALKAPEIESIAPSAGNPSGDTELSIEGKNFADGVKVLIDGKPATKLKRVGDTIVEVRTPPGRAGQMVDVVVENPDGQRANKRRAFMYDPRY